MKKFPKNRVLIFQSEIWYAWLRLHKNWMFNMEDKKCQIYFVLCTMLLNGRIGWTNESCLVLHCIVHKSLKIDWHCQPSYNLNTLPKYVHKWWRKVNEIGKIIVNFVNLVDYYSHWLTWQYSITLAPFRMCVLKHKFIPFLNVWTLST